MKHLFVITLLFLCIILLFLLRPAVDRYREDANSGEIEKGILAQIYADRFEAERLSKLNAEAEGQANLEAYLAEDDTFILVEGGTFSMGSNAGDFDERPIHSVTVTDFYLSKYEVNHAQFLIFLNDADVSSSGQLSSEEVIDMDDSDCAIDYSGDRFEFSGSDYASSDDTPVIEVTWHGAVAYAEWFSSKYGVKARLPTEAEWEYAAQGGNKSQGYKYAGSDEIDSVAWYFSNSGNKTHEVGKKAPNELGLYDMSGNVWEWCSDWYSSIYYRKSAGTAPLGPSSGSDRVERGGSWFDDESFNRVASRSIYYPSGSYFNLGFRLVLETSE